MNAQPQFFAIAMPACDSAPTSRHDYSGPTGMRRPSNDSHPTVVLRPVPTPVVDSGPTVLWTRRPAGTLPPPVANEILEARLLAILDAPIAAIETPTQGFDRKERALGNAFSELTPREASALLDRFDINYTCDALARKFNKLTDERRARLLGFLRFCCE